MPADSMRFYLFEAYILEIYDFAKADAKRKQRLYIRNKELRSVYIFLLRSRERFNGIIALYKKSPNRVEMLKFLRLSKLSLLVKSLIKT